MQILGRADKAINFIRRGQEEALTEVTLSAGPGKYPLVIQRRLTKDNLSKYRVNGAHTPGTQPSDKGGLCGRASRFWLCRGGEEEIRRG